MFDFVNDLSTLSKGLAIGAVALGISTLVSRHYDKKAVQAIIAAADEEEDEIGGQTVVDPTNPMAPQAAAAPQI